MIPQLSIFSDGLYSSDFWSSRRQSDDQTKVVVHVYKIPQCISAGGLESGADGKITIPCMCLITQGGISAEKQNKKDLLSCTI